MRSRPSPGQRGHHMVSGVKGCEKGTVVVPGERPAWQAKFKTDHGPGFLPVQLRCRPPNLVWAMQVRGN